MEHSDEKLYLIDYGQAASEKTTPKKWKKIKKWESRKNQGAGSDDNGLEVTSDQTIFENFLERFETQFSLPPRRTTEKRVTGIRSH